MQFHTLRKEVSIPLLLANLQKHFNSIIHKTKIQQNNCNSLLQLLVFFISLFLFHYSLLSDVLITAPMAQGRKVLCKYKFKLGLTVVKCLH